MNMSKARHFFGRVKVKNTQIYNNIYKLVSLFLPTDDGQLEIETCAKGKNK